MNVLFISKQKNKLTAGKEKLEQSGVKVTTVIKNDEAKQKFIEGDYQLVILGGGIDGFSKKDLKDTFVQKVPDIKILEHFGTMEELLETVNALEK